MKQVAERWEFDGKNRVLAVTIGLLPLWLLAFLSLPGPQLAVGMFEPTPAQADARDRILLVVVGLAGVLMVGGVIALWRARSASAAIRAALLLTVPSVLVMLFAPAFVLILENLNR